ncbi:hypothetical protein C8R43DRAFT_1117916 [Mycena crocata]|nr:hypothetical protein C8R43DRAFT_1117916 [Mycena crocata]
MRFRLLASVLSHFVSPYKVKGKHSAAQPRAGRSPVTPAILRPALSNFSSEEDGKRELSREIHDIDDILVKHTSKNESIPAPSSPRVHDWAHADINDILVRHTSKSESIPAPSSPRVHDPVPTTTSSPRVDSVTATGADRAPSPPLSHVSTDASSSQTTLSDDGSTVGVANLEAADVTAAVASPDAAGQEGVSPLEVFLQDIGKFNLQKWSDTFVKLGFTSMDEIWTLSQLDEDRLERTLRRLFKPVGLSPLLTISLLYAIKDLELST